LAKGSSPFPLLGLWLSWVLCNIAAVRLDPLLGSSARRFFAAPGDPFGRWVDDWVAGPRYPMYRMISRLLVVGPIIVCIAYEIWQRRPARPTDDASPRRSFLAGGVPPSDSRAPVRWPWVMLAVVVILLAVVSGRAETNPNGRGSWIVLVFVWSFAMGSWLAGRPSDAQPRDGEARTEWDTEANP
jgi:hypothetical protein